MCQTLLQDPSYFALLSRVDQGLAAERARPDCAVQRDYGDTTGWHPDRVLGRRFSDCACSSLRDCDCQLYGQVANAELSVIAGEAVPRGLV